MSFAQPFGLLALLLVIPLLAIYLLRRRHPPRLVSALFLWRTGPRQHGGGRRLDRLSREASLLLEAMAVLFGALVLADVRCAASGAGRDLVVVLDGSMSMLARGSDGSTVAERVQHEVAAHAQSGARLTLIESGPRPRLLAGPAAAPKAALAALSQWQPAGPTHDPTAALDLARRHARGGAPVLFFTDALPPEAATSGVAVHALGEPLDNAALVSAQRFVKAGKVQVRAGVANFGHAAAMLPVTFTAGNRRLVKEVQLAAGKSDIVSASFAGNDPVQVSLPDDALLADNTLTLVDSSETPLSVAVLAGLPAEAKAALGRFLAVAPAIKLDGAGRHVRFGPRASAASVTLCAPGETRTFLGPFLRDEHPLLDDVRFAGVIWVAGDDPPGHALLRAGASALITEDDQGRIHLNLDVAQSNVQRTTAWPILLANVLRRARAQVPGFSARHVPLGGAVDVVADAAGPYVLRAPDGERQLAHTGALRLEGLSPAGAYELWAAGKRIDTMHVLSMDARESDLSARGRGQTGSAPAAPLTRTPSSGAGWLSLGVLAAVLADFALTGRRRASAVAARP